MWKRSVKEAIIMRKETTKETVGGKSMADFKHPETIGLHGSDYRSDPATTAVAVQFIKLHHTNLKMQKPLQIYLV